MRSTVTYYACLCGAQAEQPAPGPESLDCWDCKKPKAMKKWTPPSVTRALPPAERNIGDGEEG